MIISSCYRSYDGDMVWNPMALNEKVIPVYEAVDDTWLEWEYRGIMCNHTGEVCNFIKIKDKWVLIYSPYNNPKYFVYASCT